MRITDPDTKIIQIKHIFPTKQLKQVFFQIYHQKYQKLPDNKNKKNLVRKINKINHFHTKSYQKLTDNKNKKN